MVGKEGFEPTQPIGNRFTVCCDSPASPFPHKSKLAGEAGLEPTTNGPKNRRATNCAIPLLYLYMFNQT